MTPKPLGVTWLAMAIVATYLAAPGAQKPAAPWLDEAKPPSWNKPGGSIPTAPKIHESPDPRCRETSRPTQLDEDKRVRDQGWDLVGAYQGGWQVLVIRGTAGYDGMCRPL